MEQEITEIANGVLQELRAYGLMESTLNQYRRGLFRPIVRFFNENNNGIYSPETYDACCRKYEYALHRRDIKRHHYQAMIKALRYIKSYAETGYVDFAPLVNTKKFIPSAASLSLINDVLVQTDLQDAFKYKLDCIMRKFFCFVEDKGLDTKDISIDLFRDFINHAYASNPGSMEYVVYSLRLLLDHYRAEGKADFNFDAQYFSPLSKPKRIIAPFSEHEVKALLSCIDTSTSVGKRNYAIILLACGTGLRGIDIVNLRISDIDWKAGEIRIIQSKTKKPVTLPISGQIRNAVADYILSGRQKTGSQNIFLRDNAPYSALRGTSALDGIIDHLCIKAGVPKQQYRSFHSLRRSFGTWMANEEVPITTISQLLGHIEMDSSKPYLSFNDQQMLACALGFADIPLKRGIYA